MKTNIAGYRKWKPYIPLLYTPFISACGGTETVIAIPAHYPLNLKPIALTITH
jgi:hypothetical protein